MKNIHRLILIALFALIGNSIFSQVIIQTQVFPPYQARIAEYLSNPQQMLINLTNTTNTTLKEQLTASIVGDNGISISVKPYYKSPSPIELQPMQSIALNANDISFLFDLSSLDVKGISMENYRYNARIPEGNYQLCIKALDYDVIRREYSLPNTGCASFFINDLEPPTISLPMNNSEVPSNLSGFMISWNFPNPTVPNIGYKLKIVEVIGNQNPNDAMNNAVNTAVFEREFFSTSHFYTTPDPVLEEGRRYAVMVQAIDQTGNAVIRNNGMSPVHTFVYGGSPLDGLAETDMTTKSLAITDFTEPDCGDCKTDIPIGATKNDLVVVGSKVKVGLFEMTVNSVNKNGTTLTGDGVIPITSISPLARLRVQFNNMKVNENLQMIDGLVQGIVMNEAAGFMPKATPPDVPTLSDFDPAKASQLISYFQQKSGQMIQNIKQSASSIGFELPFGLSSGANTIAITSIMFSPRQAWFEVAGAVKIPDSEQQVLALTGKNFCLSSTDFCAGDGKIFLSEDFRIANTFTLKKPGSDFDREPGTFVAFDKNGFKSLGIDAEYTFTSVLESAVDGSPLTVRMSANSDHGWADWIATVQMPDFRISGMRSISFSLGDKLVYYDHSDFRKPTGIPDSYDSPDESSINTADLLWNGFYIPELKITLPEIIKNSGNPLVIEGRNLIVDKNGFTGKVENQGTVVALENGSLSGWYASIDKVNINIFKSGFKESQMLGKLVLPGSKNHADASNQLDYVASLTSKVGSDIAYKFVVKEKDNIAFDVFFMTMKLTNCDLIVEGDFTSAPKADLDLAGLFTISNDPTSKIKVPGIKDIRLPGIQFKDLKLKTYENFADLSSFTIAFASPEKSLAGFEFNAKISAPTLSGSDIALPIGGTLDFAMIPGLSFAADASFSIRSGFEMKETGRIGFKTPSARIDSIKMGSEVNLGAFTIKGAIKYYYDDRNASDIREGFVGALETSISSFLTLNMRAHFGTTTAQGGFKYFDFNAMADLGQSGITFLPPVPLALYGFGGGFAYNMEVDPSSVPSADKVPVKEKTADSAIIPDKATSEKDPSKGASAMQLLDFNPSGVRLSPKKGAYSLQATVLYGLTSRNTFDADATFSISFLERGGIDNLRLVSNARVLTDVSKPLSTRKNSSTGAGNLTFKYNTTTKIFLADASIDFGVPYVGNPSLLKAHGTIVFYSGPEGWNLKFGQVDPNVNDAGVEVLGLIKGKSYLQVGSCNIDPMPPIPDKIYELASGGANNQRSQLTQTNAGNRNYKPGASESGLITGSIVELDKKDTEYTFLFFYGSLYMMSGWDFSIKPGKSCDNIANAGGPGGWYAEGQAYMGAEAAVGIKVDMFLIKGKFPTFEAGAAAHIKAGLPPVYAVGAVGGHFNILNGAISGSFSLPFSLGEKCIDSSTDVFGGLDIISELQPVAQADEKLEVSTIPAVVFNLESGKSFTIEDWNQIDGKGNPKTRHFLFDKSCITAELNGNPVNKAYLNTVDREKLTYAYQSPEFLAKNTEYTWTILAKLKEGETRLRPGMSGFNPNDYYITYNYVKEQIEQNGRYISTGNDAQQTKSVTSTPIMDLNGFDLKTLHIQRHFTATALYLPTSRLKWKL